MGSALRLASETHVLDRLEVVNVRKLLIERSPGGQDLQERWSRDRLQDQPIPDLAEQRLTAGKLESPRYANCLVAPVLEQAYDSLGLHSILPAAEHTLK